MVEQTSSRCAAGVEVLRHIVMAGALVIAAGCTVIPLDAAVPRVQPAPPVAGASSELLVAVEEGAYSDPRSLAGFLIEMDGTPRAWLPGLTGIARISVAVGDHVVRVAHPWRHVGLWGVIPLLESAQIEVRADVRCAPSATCRVAVAPRLDRLSGLQLHAREVEPEGSPP